MQPVTNSLVHGVWVPNLLNLLLGSDDFSFPFSQTHPTTQCSIKKVINWEVILLENYRYIRHQSSIHHQGCVPAQTH